MDSAAAKKALPREKERQMTEEQKGERKPIQAVKEMGRIMAAYFYELNDAAQTRSQKIAWCTSVGPAEILRSLGFLVYFPENHGAMLGATRMATDMIAEANAIGAMIVAGGKRIVAIAAVGGPDGIIPCTPCGGCRQRILEFADEATRVVLIGEAGDVESHGIDELLPSSFRL